MGLVRRLEEEIVEGRRLGRHVYHDDRSLAYAVREASDPQTVRWNRATPILDQGNVGSCTGNATVGVLGTEPFFTSLASRLSTGLTLDEAEALTIYSAAEKIDGGAGYPPEDQGSSGLSVAKVALSLNLIAGYQHVLDIATAHTAIQKGPFIVGTNWYSSFDQPSAEAIVQITAGARVRGGHEYECLGYDAPKDLWELINSWGLSYGSQGHFFYDTPTLQRLLNEDGDITPFVPLGQPAPQPAVGILPHAAHHKSWLRELIKRIFG